METRVIGVGDLEEAISLWRRGGVVAFPTETVYGLGADVYNPDACRQIFAVKGRPADNPLIVHVSGRDQFRDLCRGPVPPVAERLIEAFWPGPLTVVVPAHPSVPAVVRGGLDTVAVRWPAHPVAEALIGGLGRPVAAPSANRSGRPSPTRAEDVLADLAGRISLIVDGGSAMVGVESTVVDCTGAVPVLLRPGAIGVEQVEAVAGQVAWPEIDGPARAPGMKYVHYAPKAPVVWIRGSAVEAVRAAIAAEAAQWGVYGLLAPRDIIQGSATPLVYDLGETDETAARELFAGLRWLDRARPNAIVAVWGKETGLGLAICNRLGKAAVKQVVV